MGIPIVFESLSWNFGIQDMPQPWYNDSDSSPEQRAVTVQTLDIYTNSNYLIELLLSRDACDAFQCGTDYQLCVYVKQQDSNPFSSNSHRSK